MERIIATPLVNISIVEEDGLISGINFTDKIVGGDYSPLLADAENQLKAYFEGSLKEFSLLLAPKGTEFQMKVWQELLNIPYGQTRSYGEIAEYINNPKASRAVGMANNRNPVSIVIPCHRVIGANGKMVGYGGGIDKKVWLLEHERQNNSLVRELKIDVKNKRNA